MSRGPAEGFGVGFVSPEYALLEVFGGTTNLSRPIERNLDDIEACAVPRCGVLALVDTRARERAEVLAFGRGVGGAARRELAHAWGEKLAADPTRKLGEFLRRGAQTFGGATHLAVGFRGHGDGLGEFTAPLWARGAFFVTDPEGGGLAGPSARQVPALPSLYDVEAEGEGGRPEVGGGAERRLASDADERKVERRFVFDTMVGRALSLADIARALGGVLGPEAGRAADVLMFDSCLSGSVEIYEELRRYARAFVASEHLLPASGLPYGEMLRRLNAAEAPLGGEGWAKVAVEAFADVYRGFKPSYAWALSAFRTFADDVASPIALAFQALVGALRGMGGAFRSWPAEVAGGACASYGAIGVPCGAAEGTVDLLDLGHFFLEHPRSSAGVKSGARQLVRAIEASRIEHADLGRAAALGGRSGGLSIWLAPAASWQDGLLPSYKSLAFNRITGWADYVESLVRADAPAARARAGEPAADLAAAPGRPAGPRATAAPAGDPWGGATRKALVVGCDTFGLRGAAGDARRMAAALEGRGFRVDALEGRAATRDALLARYDALVERARPGDAVVVHFSGHGGLVANPRYGAGSTREPEFFQFLVPADFGETGRAPFRGVLSYELSLRLARLTERTRNATIVLDCCHAAQMSRGDSLVPKALPEPIVSGLDELLACLRVDPAELARIDALGNPHAVRLVACDVDQVAYERRAGGEAGGLLTEAFVRALGEAGEADVAWRVFLARVRELVGARSSSQRPSVEGPSGRALFSADAPRRGRVLSLLRAGDELFLDGGRIAGVAPGDEYALMPLGAARYDEREKRATARVIAAGPLRSRVALDGPAPDELAGAPAFPTRRAPRPLRVWFHGDGRARGLLAEALAGSRLLVLAETGGETPGGVRAAGPHVTADGREVIEPDVSAEGAALVVRARGRELFAPLPLRGGSDAYGELVEKLERLALERSLRESFGEHGIDRGELDVELGLVEGGQSRPKGAGALFALGDSLYLHLRNRGARTLHLHVFNLGITRTFDLLSKSHPLGIKLEPGREHTLGRHHATGALVGMRLWLPDDAPAGPTFAESLVVFALSAPHSLQALASPAEATRGGPPARSGALAGGDATETIAQGASPFEHEPYLALELPFRLGR
ncbi:MAG TPA: caspase family protein [Polyangiaceae bacterium]|nr:caspase family protein [Polyangiaceae bacterium]